MPFNLFVSTQPNYKGVGNQSPKSPRSGFFGAVANLVGGDQTPAYRTVARVVAEPASGPDDQATLEPAPVPSRGQPVRTAVVTIIVEQYGDEPSGEPSPEGSID